MFSSVFRRRRTDVLRQNFAFSYVLLRYVSHEPVSEFSIVSSSPRYIRICNKIFNTFVKICKNFMKKRNIYQNNYETIGNVRIIYTSVIIKYSRIAMIFKRLRIVCICLIVSLTINMSENLRDAK